MKFVFQFRTYKKTANEVEERVNIWNLPGFPQLKSHIFTFGPLNVGDSLTTNQLDSFGTARYRNTLTRRNL